MKCKKCDNIINLTEDGYCLKHKFYSNDNIVISNYISNYITNTQNEKYKTNRIIIIINLFNYLLNHIEFINNNEKFQLVVIKKINELRSEINSLKKLNDTKLKDIALKSLNQLNNSI